MKTLITFIALSFLTPLAEAQKYIPLPLECAYWRIESWGVDPPYTSEYVIRTNGDTLINDLIYVKIVGDNQSCCSCSSPSSAYVAAIRQDTMERKIYVIEKDSIIEKILYDFTQSIGDTVNSVLTKTCGAVIIGDIDSMMISGIYHRRLLFAKDFGCLGYDSGFIEGLGSTTGLLSDLVGFEWGDRLLCAGVNEKTIFPDSSSQCRKLVTYFNSKLILDDFTISLFPNPASNGFFEIKFNKQIRKATMKIHDLLSREIESIYLSNSTGLIIENNNLKNGMFIISIHEQGQGVYYFKLFCQ